MENRILRLENLRLLVSEFGSIVSVARKCDTAEAYLSQLLTGAPLGSGGDRSMGHKLARKLEVGCKKPVGWMDQDHKAHEYMLAGMYEELRRLGIAAGEQTSVSPAGGLTEDALLAARAMDALPSDMRHQLRLLLENIASATHGAQQHHADRTKSENKFTNAGYLDGDSIEKPSTAKDRNRRKRA